ncbi:methyltransferase domain-containing protein [Belnapia sp. T6]|uniref:Methyltransferase domain-containing protein n=1 Tax=Belnapia mucosa TaxID=2804532 RepID=A0ABS1V5K8_9PROT|nr:methyltransferase domain-containing protein [Belnapia mucosa]MBL6455989.1 methyltransferase domain-containing protein [Belnapia mucosa]
MRERSAAAEWMDDAAATEAEFASALRDLARINRMSLAYRPTLRWLDRLVAETGVRQLSVLDIGFGGGDMLAAVARWGERRGVAVELVGLDRSPWAARYAAAAGIEARFITADLFDLPESERFDVVLCSLFTHHLRDPELVRFLRWLPGRARRGWLISDLHRHWLPWSFVWGAVRALRMDPMVVHDSTVSIARGFTRADWERLVAEAGIAARIDWAFPFKWIVSARA